MQDGRQTLVFQFHKVQFKGYVGKFKDHWQHSFNSIRYNLKILPHRNEVLYPKFQFHKVQFKVQSYTTENRPTKSFQFHKVQFKETTYKLDNEYVRVSIP